MKEKKPLSISYFGQSDIGLVREENQDSFGKFPVDNSNLYQPKGLLFIVADGIGGLSGGKEASHTAVETVSQEYFSSDSDVISDALLTAFKAANQRIHQSSINVPQFKRSGTTCTALVLQNDIAYLSHVGDSRIYKITDDKIEQLTNDHTQVEELLRKGIISKEETMDHPSKSVLVRALGIEPEVNIDLIDRIKIIEGDNFVLCSDGLAKVGLDELKTIVLNNWSEESCKKLIAQANECGGTDNVTVLVIKIIGNSKEHFIDKDKIKKSSRHKLLIIYLLFLIIAAIIETVFIYKNEILKLFSWTT